MGKINQVKIQQPTKPIFKCGDKLEVTNYRPITLITGLAKVIEKIIKAQMTSFLSKHKILAEQQYGFREKRSSQDAMVDLTTKIYKTLEQRRAAMAVFVDLAKAFDTVDHDQLLESLHKIGFRGIPYNLFKDYLTNRPQYVTIQNEASEIKQVEFGVPQGTVLGPILFNIYLNDLFSLNLAGQITSFADDTVIFFEAENWTSLKRTVELEMTKVFHFFKAKLLTVNTTKSYCIPFTSYGKYLPRYDQVTVFEHCACPNEVIHIALKGKYLGILIDAHLRWDYHAQVVAKKVRSLLYKFKYLKRFFSIVHLRILYHALVEPHLTYGILAWGGITNNYLTPLEKVQKWVLKIIYSKNRSFPSNELYQQSQMLDIRGYFCLMILTNQHKNRAQLCHLDHRYETRNKENTTKTPATTKTMTQRSYYFLGPHIYNKIPNTLKAINSNKLFKKRIKTWILEKPRIYIHSLIDIENTYYTDKLYLLRTYNIQI